MDGLSGRKIEELVDLTFDCSCGRSHSVDIKKICLGKNIAGYIPELLMSNKSGYILLVADGNTYRASGGKIAEALDSGGFCCRSLIFDADPPLVPDERALGWLMIEAQEDTSLILAVGSGTINDLCRFAGYKLGIPYMIAGTAPSMDGYASTVSPLIVRGMKKTFNAVYPIAVLGDLDIMSKSPMDMIRAGFGDVLGKRTAVADWRLSAEINGEYICHACIDLVNNAVDSCISNREGIAARDENAIRLLMEALVKTGIAIGLAGSSRPASGAEHHLAHYWEVDALARGVTHPLHGNSVGVGTVVISHIYDMVRREYDIGFDTPDPAQISGYLKSVGAADNPADLGIDRKVFTQSILHAKEIRPRYTVLHLAERLGILEKAASELTGRFF